MRERQVEVGEQVAGGEPLGPDRELVDDAEHLGDADDIEVQHLQHGGVEDQVEVRLDHVLAGRGHAVHDHPVHASERIEVRLDRADRLVRRGAIAAVGQSLDRLQREIQLETGRGIGCAR